MSETVILVEHLSKKYIISHLNRGRGNTETFREAVTERTKRLFGFSSKNAAANTTEELLALNDVSFDIEQGERVGIIGRNGAGKSTLLKILSRITEPTTGKIEITGRVASLLEVGTGFHPELTGRENIFLNGAVLGMGRQEISKKFDEIVEFAEIEKFLDTPVKRYSSGMYVRLAFAVAAHLEPDILIVDEVLAVGDAQFQKKCLGKMEDVGKSGRTILFVSHNMGIIRQLCSRSFLLEKGNIVESGNTENVIAKYLSSGVVQDGSVVDLSRHPNRLGGMKPILRKLSIRNKLGTLSTEFTQGDPISIVIEYESHENIPMSGCGFILHNSEGIRVGGGNTYMGSMPPHRIPSKGRIIFNILPKQFTPDKLFVTVSLGTHQSVLIDKVENAISFSISQYDIYGTGYLLTKEDGVAAIAFSCDISAT